MLGLKHAVRHGGALRLESMRYARHECTECAEIRHAGRHSSARQPEGHGAYKAQVHWGVLEIRHAVRHSGARRPGKHGPVQGGRVKVSR